MSSLAPARFAIITGTANKPLGAAVADALEIECASCDIGRFPDSEVSVLLHEAVRGRKIFVLQSTSPPVDANLMELVALVDACRRASAAQVTAVIPYFGYARSDKRHRGCEPIMASVVAHILHGAGVEQVITIDLHTAQIEGFFHIPVESLSAVPILCESFRGRLPRDTVVISPDEGRVKTATNYARLLGLPVGVIHKERVSGTETRVKHVVGDVKDRPCLIIDDMISTGGTIAGAIEAVLGAGARPEIIVAATHGLLLPGAREKLSHPAVREVVITDTIEIADRWAPLKVVSIAPLIAKTIRHNAYHLSR